MHKVRKDLGHKPSLSLRLKSLECEMNELCGLLTGCSLLKGIPYPTVKTGNLNSKAQKEKKKIIKNL